MSKVVKQTWHLFDAKSQIVGRLGQHIATVLMGKHKPTYTPNVDCGDTVVVVNAKDIQFSGRKWEQKVYRRHTKYVSLLCHIFGGLAIAQSSSLLGTPASPSILVPFFLRSYIGGLKEVPVIVWRTKAPERILLHAVRGMIPKTKHKLNQLARLKVFPGAEHPYVAMFPNHPVTLNTSASSSSGEITKDSWDFPEDFPAALQRKILASVEYKVDPQNLSKLNLVTQQYK
jgi:large subunit ribosomal protein L13